VSGTADHVLRNRAAWDRWAAEHAGPGLRNWAAAEPSWGIWGIAEAQAGVLPADLEGRDSIELGCGTGYVSAWLARRGARPAGLDNSAAQLATARQLQDRSGLRFPLIHASAERAPLADGRFDLAISEYGASIWCDPYAWIPEAARLLRPGGQLIFLVNSVLLMLTVPDTDGVPATERLLRPYFGMHRFEWPDDESVEFHLGHGEGVRHPSIAPYGPYRTGDGTIFLGVQNDREWATLCGEILQRPGLAEDPRFRSNTDRVDNNTELTAILEEAFADLGADRVSGMLDRAGIADPGGPRRTGGSAVGVLAA
jgi:SAM-dependent methyltransferase